MRRDWCPKGCREFYGHRFFGGYAVARCRGCRRMRRLRFTGRLVVA